MKNLTKLTFAFLIVLLIGCQTKLPVKQDVITVNCPEFQEDIVLRILKNK